MLVNMCLYITNSIHRPIAGNQAVNLRFRPPSCILLISCIPQCWFDGLLPPADQLSHSPGDQPQMLGGPLPISSSVWSRPQPVHLFSPRHARWNKGVPPCSQLASSQPTPPTRKPTTSLPVASQLPGSQQANKIHLATTQQFDSQPSSQRSA